MSGPNDGSAGDTPAGDFKPTLGYAAPNTLSSRFRLHLHWETPRLEWRPTLAVALPSRDQPAFLQLDDPFAAVLAFERYITSGSLLFDLRRPNFDLVDKAFLDAPTLPPSLLPSFAQLRAMEDDAFYCRLGRPAPLFGAPAPAPLLTPPFGAPPPPSPFYKLPAPAAMGAEPSAPRAGAVGDVLKALWGLPIVQLNANKLEGIAMNQVHVLKRDWDKAPWRDRITAITLATPLAAGVVGAVLGVSDARHLAFGLLKGADIPVPFVRGLKLHVDDFGKADPFLLSKPNDPSQPRSLQVGLKFDVLEAIPTLKKLF